MSISSKGLAGIVTHYREGIAAVEAALDGALTEEAVVARDDRAAELDAAGVPAELARRLASLPVLTAAPDIVLVAERTGQNIADVTATYFAAEVLLPARPHHAGGAGDQGVGLFRPAGARPRARLDRRRRAPHDRGDDGRAAPPGPPRLTPGSACGQADVQRIRAAVHEIANSGLTLSKLSVAASLLGDLVRN